MTFEALSEHIGQSLIILATMEALSAIITVLFYVTLATFIVYLLGVPYLKIVGGLLLFWIAYKLLQPEDEAHGEGEGVSAAGNLFQAIKTIVIADEEIREALRESVMTIVDTVRTCLERTPPELAADIVEKGIILTGGGALLRGLDDLLRRETHLPVTVADEPLSCVALGTGKMLEAMDLLKKIALPN